MIAMKFLHWLRFEFWDGLEMEHNGNVNSEKKKNDGFHSYDYASMLVRMFKVARS